MSTDWAGMIGRKERKIQKWGTAIFNREIGEIREKVTERISHKKTEDTIGTEVDRPLFVTAKSRSKVRRQQQVFYLAETAVKTREAEFKQ